MDPELKRELAEMHALAKDNHRMLRSIRRDQWFGLIGKIIFWIVIIVFPLYFYQQYLRPIVSKFSAASGIAPSATSADSPTTTELQKLLDLFKGGK